VTIDDDRIIGQFVIPVDAVVKTEDDRKMADALGVQGRYINATAAIKLSLRDGRLDVRLDQIRASGKRLPGLMANWLREQNLGQRMLEENADMREGIRKLESIEVKEGKIVIKGRAGGPVEPAPAPAPGTQTPAPRSGRREDW
jgi:hypothetical protein